MHSLSAISAPAAPPRGVMATVLSSTSIRVQWTQLLEVERNGIITNYEVRYRYNSLTPLTILTAGTELETMLNMLEEAEIYSIDVLAYTSVGPGPYSDPIQLRTEEAGM